MNYIIKNFFTKYFTTKLDLNYSDDLNLFKTAVLFFIRSKVLIISSIIIPFFLFILSIFVNSTTDILVIIFKVLTIVISMLLAASLGFSINNTSFYKKIIIKTGVKKYHMLIPAIIIFVFQMLNLGIVILYTSIFYFSAKRYYPVIPDFVFVCFLIIVTSILIGIFIANFFHEQSIVFSVVLFFSFFNILFIDQKFFISSKIYSQLTYFIPYRYFSFLETESLNSNGGINNITGSSIFDVESRYIVLGLGNQSKDWDTTSYQSFLNSDLSNSFMSGISSAPSGTLDLIPSTQPKNEFNIDDVLKIFSKASIHAKLEIQDIVWKLKNKLIIPPSSVSSSGGGIAFLVLANSVDKIFNLIMPWVFIVLITGSIFCLDPLKRRKY